MNRIIVTIVCALALVGVGCAGEDGPAGPPGSGGNPGSPVPINALLAGSEPADTLQAVAIDLFSRGLFPLGSVINIVDVTDSIPPLSFLSEYDAVLVWTTSPVTDPVMLGERLAEYVDDGGGVVIGQMSFVDGWALLGRFMSDYSPLQPTASTGIAVARQIDFNSVSLPLHPILNGVNLRVFPFYSTNQWSNPSLDIGATLIAKDTPSGANAIAVNAAGNVIGLNMSGNHMRGGYSEPPKLIVNALLFVAGAF